MDIVELLKEATKDTLSEENLEKIVEAVDARAQELVNEQKEKVDLKRCLKRSTKITLASLSSYLSLWIRSTLLPLDNC